MIERDDDQSHTSLKEASLGLFLTVYTRVFFFFHPIPILFETCSSRHQRPSPGDFVENVYFNGFVLRER